MKNNDENFYETIHFQLVYFVVNLQRTKTECVIREYIVNAPKIYVSQSADMD